MANFNKVILLGNLTRDPTLKYLPSGTPVVEFGLAVNRSWNDQASGERREATTFVDCRSLGKPAEILNQYCRKGRPLFIEGRLEYRSWEAKDGGRRSKLEVFVENFQFLGGRREEGSEPAATSRPPVARSGRQEEVTEPLENPFEAAAGPDDGADDDVPF